MPSVSKETSTPIDMGDAGREWRGELDGYTTSFVETSVAADLTELLKGLPGDACPSPHWGYVFKGRVWFRSGERRESFGPGQAYYVEPGHTAGADAGSEFVVFSPTEVLAEVEAHMMQRMQQDASIG